MLIPSCTLQFNQDKRRLDRLAIGTAFLFDSALEVSSYGSSRSRGRSPTAGQVALMWKNPDFRALPYRAFQENFAIEATDGSRAQKFEPVSPALRVMMQANPTVKDPSKLALNDACSKCSALMTILGARE